MLASNGKIMNSFLLKRDRFQPRFESKTPIKTTGSKLGMDQGINTCITCSDKQITKADRHGHTYKSIAQKIAKKKKGTKAFKKAQAHRKNYVNAAINKLNMNNIKELHLEDIRYLGKGQSKSRLLQAFAHKEIKTQIEKRCKQEGVLLVYQPSPYKSQRCNSCGFTHKSNRNNELFECKACNHTDNADINSALNQIADLAHLGFIKRPNKTTGFYWNSAGTWLPGEEPIVPHVTKEQFNILQNVRF